MSLVFSRGWYVILAILLAFFGGTVAATLDSDHGNETVLRVAADPNNLPFSNGRGEGFENQIAELVARELGKKLEYVWRAQRRGFFRETLKEGRADLVMGVPAGFDMALTSIPYYRSSYVFVTRQNRGMKVSSFDELILRTAKVGIQLVGDDGVNTPPAHALANRGIVTNVVGFTLYGDYREPNPPARIVEAVARGDLDVAVVWGPLPAYFNRTQGLNLEITPVIASPEDQPLKFDFSIAMGVRKGNQALRDSLNEIIRKRRFEVETILKTFGVPSMPLKEDFVKREVP